MTTRRNVLSALAAVPLAACATRPARTRTLKVATFNIWHDLGDWPLRRPLVIETLRALDADVIALQEVLEDADKGLPNQAETIAQALGGPGGAYQVAFVSTDPQGARRRYGNALLSRRPILWTDTVFLEPSEDSRTAIRARIDLGDATAEVVNTHFHHTAEGAPIRARQAAHLIDWMGRATSPRIVMGDFNAPLDDAGLTGLTQAFVSALPAGAAATTLNPADGHASRVIDHVFVEPRIQVLSSGVAGDQRGHQGDRLPSDHFAVHATLAIPA